MKSNQITILDGAMGSFLMAEHNIKKIGDLLLFNKTNPQAVLKAHSLYLEAGADVIQTNSFGLNWSNLQKTLRLDNALTQQSLQQLNQLSVELAQKAREIVNPQAKIHGVLGPMGLLLYDQSSAQKELLFEKYILQLQILLCDEVDLIRLETFTDILELEIAIKAILELDCCKPIFVSCVFDEKGRTIMGTSIEDFFSRFDAEVEIWGINCVASKASILNFLQISRQYQKKLAVIPNAGLPQVKAGKVNYEMSITDFVRDMKLYQQEQASILGGCCGTNPSFIKALSALKK